VTTYSTNFPSAPENPVSEGGALHSNAPTNGFTVLKSVASPNRAVGTQNGLGNPDDSYTILTGTWSGNHQIQGTVYNLDSSANSELELHLRFVDTSTTATGYECNVQCSGGYYQIVAWLGAEGSFSIIANNSTGPFPAGTMPPATGDIMRAFINNRDISWGINKSPGFAGFQELISVADTTWTTGNPSFGTFYNGGNQLDEGWTSITAADLAGAQVRQSKVAHAAANTATVTLPQAVLAGSCVVVAALSFATTFSTLTIADGSSDAFTDSGKGAFVDAFAISRMGAFLTPTTGVTTFTATSNATGGTPGTEIWAWEITGLSAPITIDKVAAATGSGLNASSGSTGTLSTNNEVALGFVVTSTTAQFPGVGWITGGAPLSTSGNFGLYQPLSSTAAVTGTATLNPTGNWRAWALTVTGPQTGPTLTLQGGKSLRFT
jgi:hypothetical protein